VRRKEKQIDDPAEIQRVLQAATVCFLALYDDDAPYVVPLSFAYTDGRLYFHSAREGRKITLIRSHPRVGFAVGIETGLVPGAGACDWGMHYRSVIGRGRAVIVEDDPEKVRALDLIMAHYGGPAGGYDPRRVAATCVIRLEIEAMSGKRSG